MGHTCTHKKSFEVYVCHSMNMQAQGILINIATALATCLFGDLILATCAALGIREQQYFLKDQLLPPATRIYSQPTGSWTFLQEKEMRMQSFWMAESVFNFLIFRIKNFLYKSILLEWMFMHHIHAWWLQKRAREPLKLKLQILVSHDVVPGIKPGYLGRATSVLYQLSFQLPVLF